MTLFSTVAQSLRAIEQTTSRLEMTAHLADLFGALTSSEAEFIAYFLLGSLYPPYENKPNNCAEKQVVRAVARFLGVSVAEVEAGARAYGDTGTWCASVMAGAGRGDSDQPDAERAFVPQSRGAERGAAANEKKLVIASEAGAVPSSRGAERRGDPGEDSVASSGDKKQITIAECEERLRAIVSLSGAGSQEVRESLLVELLERVSPDEALILLRFLSGKLRLGCSDMTVLDAYSLMLVGDKSLRAVCEHAYNVSADLGLLARVAKSSGREGLAALSMTPGIPVRPAAAERLATADDISAKLGTCVSQPKLDGFRVQIHVWREEGRFHARFFSRNLHDMSEMFPEFLSFFSPLSSGSASSVILEGEAIAYNPETGEELPFQETAKRRRKHGVDEHAVALPLRLYLFDIIYRNGQSLLSLPHSERRAQLSELCGDRDISVSCGAAQVLVIDETLCTTGEELSLAFDTALSLGYEGIVAKRIDAPYRPGKRDFNWIKLKRQETGSLHDTLDCVILGYYYGRGKRASYGIGAFLVGIFNPEADRYETIAKIGTGLTDDEWRELKARCDAQVINEMPREVLCNRLLVPDVIVAPTIVAMIRADNITRSPLHTAASRVDSPGYALRFPRLMGYRPDKSATDTTSPTEVRELYALQNLRSGENA